MIKKAIQLLLVLLWTYMNGVAQELPILKNHSIISRVSGDLDMDGVNELVIAFTPINDPSEDLPRKLIIYKMADNQWVVWKKSDQALLGSLEGGVMGDPFGEIVIKNGILIISHQGGSSWKWGHTDKYRYQDGEFYLIGYTSIAGRLCEYWKQVDFNLSTGKMVVKKEYENCEVPDSDQVIYKRENETFFEKGIKITLQNRRGREIKIVTPKYSHNVYLSVMN